MTWTDSKKVLRSLLLCRGYGNIPDISLQIDMRLTDHSWLQSTLSYVSTENDPVAQLSVR